jgi:tetratricopeptide (TPR) repeat protein
VAVDFATMETEDGRYTAPVVQAYILSSLGNLDQARRLRDGSLQRARQFGHKPTLAFALATSVMHCRITSSAREMLERVEEILAACATEDLYTARFATFVRSLCMALLGRGRASVAFAAERLSAIAGGEALLLEPAMRLWLADTFRGLDETREGLAQIDQAIRVTEGAGMRYAEAEMHSIRGELLFAAGDPGAAEESFHRAIGVAQRQSAKLYELRAALGLARLWRERGKDDAAQSLLWSAYGWFTEGFDTLDLVAAKALLDELGASTGAP